MLHNLSTILPAIAHVAASCMLAAAPCALASEFHVAVSGNDSADGSAAHPLKTISAAAQKAMPGDTVTVHAGTYREWVKPPRGGNSEQNRITYAAAKGEAVVITGSEAPTGWKKISEGVWELTLPNTFFKEANPFDEQIYGSWYLSYGKPVLTGNVFLDVPDIDLVGVSPALGAVVNHVTDCCWIVGGAPLDFQIRGIR